MNRAYIRRKPGTLARSTNIRAPLSFEKATNDRCPVGGQECPRYEEPAATATQEGLLAFLLKPASYPHRPTQVRFVQTHSAFVFIAPPFVFKVKKPVNLGFLDFSTLAKRRHFCQREVELNRRLSPRVYLGVVPIWVRDGRLTFRPGEEIVEYAVKMRQLSQPYFLDQLLARGAVKPKDLDRIAATLQRFYRAQHPTSRITAWGGIARLRISTDENFRQTAKYVEHTLSGAAYHGIRQYTDQFFKNHADLLRARVREKWIRDCHGDLHLEHVHLTRRSLHIYDCIEFNDRLRYVDVASDVAFLAMDLDYKGRPDLARYFTQRMASELSDDGMQRLMDFYKCYRAYVRGKVERLQSAEPSATAAERKASTKRARRYFQLALRYAVAGSQPLILAVTGRIASGKSTLAKGLSAELGWPIYSSDRVRKKRAGLPLHRRSDAAARHRLYANAITEKTYQKLLALAEAEVRADRSVILDATFARPQHRAALVQRARRLGVDCRFIEAQASDAAVKQRLRARGQKQKE